MTITADNTSAAIMEYYRAGLTLPAGIFIVRDTLEFGTGCGGELAGRGKGDQSRNHNALKDHPTTVLVWGGEPGKPIARIRRSSFSMRGVHLVGCVVKDYMLDRGQGPLVEVTQEGAKWPVGNIDFDISMSNSKCGLYFAPGSHCDHIKSRILSHHVDVPYRINENQSVDHKLDLMIKGDYDVAIEAINGGRLNDSRVATNGRGNVLLATGSASSYPTKNNGFYEIKLIADGGDKIGSLYEERFVYAWGMADVTIRGTAAADTVIGDPKLREKSISRVDIELKQFPKDYEYKYGA